MEIQAKRTFNGAKELTTLNTPESFEITIASNLDNMAKCYLFANEIDPNEDTCDTDGARLEALLKKGSQTGTGTQLDAQGAIPGTRARCIRTAANTFDGGNNPRFTQYRGGEIDIPIIDGNAKVTLSVKQSGAASLKGSVAYAGIVVIVK